MLIEILFVFLIAFRGSIDDGDLQIPQSFTQRASADPGDLFGLGPVTSEPSQGGG